MTLPFHPRPGDPDADHLNTLLDAMRSGTVAPDMASIESTEAAALADAAGQLRGLVQRADAPAAAYLTEHPLQHRWEDIMSVSFPTAPPHSAANGASVPSSPVSNRTRRLAEPPTPNRLNTWLSAAIVAVLLLGMIGGAWWLGPGQDGPGEDPVRLAAITQGDATPDTGTSAQAPLMELLSAVPVTLPGEGDLPLRDWAYADIGQQFANLGLTQEAIAEDRMLPLGMNAFGPLAWTSGVFVHAADDELVAAIGFDPYTVQQVLVAGETPNMLTLLRGDWDESTMIAAWEASGYTQHTTESGVTIWSIGPEGEINPTHPIQSKMFQQLNNVAILDGGILAYAGTLDTIEQVIRAQAGEIPVASQDADMEGLVTALPDDMVSSIGYDMPGSALYNQEEIQQNPNISPEDKEKIEEPFAASLQAVGPMPEYRGAVFALAGGGEDDAEAVAILGAESEEDAAQIVHVIEWRWQNFLSQRYQRPLESLMPLIDARTDGTTVILRFDTQGVPEMWLNLLNSGDLAAFAVDTQDPGVSATPAATPEG